MSIDAPDLALAKELAVTMAADAQQAEWVAGAMKVQAITLIADAMPVLDSDDAIVPEDQCTHGGDGDWGPPLPDGLPLIHEGVLVQVSAIFGLSHESSRNLVLEVMELKHRLPRLWRLVQEIELPVWRARMVARQTQGHPAVVADEIDEFLATNRSKITFSRVEGAIREARLRHDTERLAAEDEAKLEQRGVWSYANANSPHVRDLVMRLDTADAIRLDHLISEVAHDLLVQGDTDSLDVRRARAAALLADPDYRSQHQRTDASSAGNVELFLHVRPETIDHLPGGATDEALGTFCVETIKAWLGDRKVHVRPVVDCNRDWSVEKHDPPETMREQVINTYDICVFPGCARRARRCDLDHIVPWPAGPTSPANLAPLCRRHHRYKTHHRWRYHSNPDGTFTWTDPSGMIHHPQ